LLYKIADKRLDNYLKQVDNENKQKSNNLNCRPYGFSPKQYLVIDNIATPIFPYLSYKMYQKGQKTKNNWWKATGLLFGGWTGYNITKNLKEDIERVKYCENKKNNKSK